ncbi:MAG: MATE family efflux transporter [Halobaculum sp.]
MSDATRRELFPSVTRTRTVWRRTARLAAPLVGGHLLITAMQTVDVFIAATISTAAITAIGLADLFVGLTVTVGVSTGKSVLAVTSQDTGAGSGTREEAITLALVLGAVLGVPFVVFGRTVATEAIRLVGAPSGVATLGGTYLGIVLLSAPAYHVGLIASGAIKGTGDTRTPMVVDAGVNFLNIVGSVALGLGVAGAPRLGVVGIAAATAVANGCLAVVYLGLLVSDRVEAGVAVPSTPVVTLQLIRIGVPRLVESLVTSLARFPLNAVFLQFGVAVTAGYHLARRVNRQVTSPLRRGLTSANSIVTGQGIGEGDDVRPDAVAVTLFGVVVLAVVGAAVYVAAPVIAHYSTEGETVVGPAVGFMRAYAVGGVLMIAYNLLAGSLLGGGETRITLYARLIGTVVVTLGGTYVGGVLLGFGVGAAYAAILLSPLVMTLVVFAEFRSDGWLDRADRMIASRTTSEE